MRKTINTTHIEGWLYQHALSLKVTGEKSKNPGTQFINGTIDVATNDAMTNIVTIHFSYVTPTYAKSGSPNATFNALQNIINGVTCNVIEHGADRAAKIRIDSQVGLNEFWSTRNNPEGEVVSQIRNEGGFIHVVQTVAAAEGLRDIFKTDMVVTGVRRIEADPTRGREEKVEIKGYVFDFRNALLPVTYYAYGGGMDHFEALEASVNNPVFLCVNGHQVSKTVTTVRESENSGWGETFAQEVTSTQREFVVTGADSPYEWDTEESITAQEYKEALQNREMAIAEIKTRQEEYEASRAQTQAPASTANFASGFNF